MARTRSEMVAEKRAWSEKPSASATEVRSKIRWRLGEGDFQGLSLRELKHVLSKELVKTLGISETLADLRATSDIFQMTTTAELMGGLENVQTEAEFQDSLNEFGMVATDPVGLPGTGISGGGSPSLYDDPSQVLRNFRQNVGPAPDDTQASSILGQLVSGNVANQISLTPGPTQFSAQMGPTQFPPPIGGSQVAIHSLTGGEGEVGPYARYLGARGISALPGTAAERYVGSLYNPMQNLYEMQNLLSLQEQVPGTVMPTRPDWESYAGTFGGGAAPIQAESLDVLRRLAASQTLPNVSDVPRLSWSQVYDPDTDMATGKGTRPLIELQRLIRSGLTSAYGGTGAAWLANQLPDMRTAYEMRVAQGTTNTGSFLEMLKNRFGF